MLIWKYGVGKGSVAQWLEQGIHKPKVVGSNPTRAIYFKIVKKQNTILSFLVWEKWLSGRKQ